MTATYSEILDAAKDAALRIVQGSISSYSLNGVQYTYSNLPDLQKLIDWLEGQVARESGIRPPILLADISRGGYS